MFYLKSLKNAYLVIFYHRHGINRGVVLADQEPSSVEACKALGWDYEPPADNEVSDEYVEIDRLTETEIPAINNAESGR